MKRVLIIESEIVPRLLYQTKFQTVGFEAIAVGSRKEALAAFQRHIIDLVVIDLFAKNYCSLEVIQALLEIKPKLPILANGAIHDFWKHAHEHIKDIYAALTPDLNTLVEEAKRLVGHPSKLDVRTQTPSRFTAVRNGKLAIY
jgi:DNA-binding NtrC family response regulator